MPEGCSIIWAELCFPIICLLGKGSRGSIITDISVKVTEEDYNAVVSRKRKGKWGKGQTVTVLSLELCLWHFFRAKNTLWMKCHRQMLVPAQYLPAHPSRGSQGSRTGNWGFPARHISSTAASKGPFQQHCVLMEEAKMCCCLATSVYVMVPGKIMVNSIDSEKPWSVSKM